MKWIHGLRARLRLLRRGAAEERMQEEMRFHLDMETEKLIRAGHTPAEARRRAVLAFGGVEGHKEAMRDGRTLAWLGGLSLDLRLGVRMMRKAPGLSAVGVFSIAVGVAFGALGFELLSALLQTELPLEEGDRIVSLQYATDTPGSPERRLLRDFVEWRGQLTSVRELGAYERMSLTLEAGEAPPQPVEVAAITAAGFGVPRVPPLLGRPLLAEDERPGAPRVLVIGYEAWQRRFGGDPRVVGRTVRLGAGPATVVGVMPEGFRFPFDHQFWVPLQADPAAHPRLGGPRLRVFGRLAPGADLAEAEAELAVVGGRAAAEHPGLYERLRPRVVAYTHEHTDLDHPALLWLLRAAQLLVGGLLVVVAVNLAVLVYARTVARVGELAVRSALGASRRRILGQLFLEALALSTLGALAGLGVAELAFRWLGRQLAHTGDLPFWVELDLSAGTVLYALALSAVAAAIMGVIPGLRVTGGGLASRLRELGGGTGPRLGRAWTALIVVQVAAAVAILPLTVYSVARVLRTDRAELGFRENEFAVGSFGFSEETPLPPDSAWAGSAERALFAARQSELLRRLQAEPGVAAVAFSRGVPGVRGPTRLVELDGGPAAAGAAERRAEPKQADAALFGAYDAAIVLGRGLREDDPDEVVVVNRTWVRHFLGDAPPLGRRFRYVARPATPFRPADAPEPWREIVGVVEDFPAVPVGMGALSDGEATVYHPMAAGAVHPVTLSVRYQGALPAGATGRLRAIGAEVDPSMRLSLRPLRETYASLRGAPRMVAVQFAVFAIAALLLSAAGIYALMSFTVARRTREIGIRSALGADARRILVSVFSRVAGQLALGVGAGALLGGAIVGATGFGAEQLPALLVAAAAIILAVGALATVGPARRGLRVQPSEALREG